MKGFLITGSIFFTVLLLIIAFENIAASCQGFLFLFFPLDINPFFIVSFIALVGMVTGVFFTALIMKMLKSNAEEQEALEE